MCVNVYVLKVLSVLILIFKFTLKANFIFLQNYGRIKNIGPLTSLILYSCNTIISYPHGSRIFWNIKQIKSYPAFEFFSWSLTAFRIKSELEPHHDLEGPLWPDLFPPLRPALSHFHLCSSSLPSFLASKLAEPVFLSEPLHLMVLLPAHVRVLLKQELPIRSLCFTFPCVMVLRAFITFWNCLVCSFI